jgi:hypothetical protein
MTLQIAVLKQLLSINRDLTELLLTENEFPNETKEQFKNIEEKYRINLR